MRAVLTQQGVVNSLGKCLAEMKDDEWTKMDENAMASIQLCLVDDVLYNVMKEKITVETWTKLGNIYAKKSLENRMYLMMQLFTLKMAEGTDVEDHISTFNKLICKLLDFSEQMKDEYLALILLNSLPSSYESLRVSLCAGRDTISVETVTSVLQSKAMRQKR